MHQELTYADLIHLPYATLLVEGAKYTGLTDATKRPNVARWYGDISTRESWINVQKAKHDWLVKAGMA